MPSLVADKRLVPPIIGTSGRNGSSWSVSVEGIVPKGCIKGQAKGHSMETSVLEN